jgi:hypothetical protein
LARQKDTNAIAQANGIDNTKKKLEESGKGFLNNFLSKKKKDSVK